MQQVLTIIIPTRDRADTLKYTLQTITSQPNQNIEIIVSDNFSGPAVKQVVDSVTDNRLRYIRTDKIIGMAEHYEFALSHATGNWVTIVGDDDGLLPNAVDKFLAVIAKNPNIKAVTCANCFYRWPVSGKKSKIEIISGKGYEIRDSKEYTLKSVTGKPVSQPTIYTGGFVHMDIIRQAKALSDNGKFFQSINPDIYSGMAICALTDKYIYSWEAWGVAGISKHSIGMAHKNKSKEEIKKMAFHNENQNKFHPTLGDAADACVGSPLIYLYEAFLKSRHLDNGNQMGVTLTKQLELFIARAGKRIKQPVIDCCRDIAALNKLEFAPILSAAKKKRPIYKLQKFARKFNTKILGRSKLPRKVIYDVNIQNIYDASVKIGKVLNG